MRTFCVDSGMEGDMKTFVGLMLLMEISLSMVLSGTGPLDAVA